MSTLGPDWLKRLEAIVAADAALCYEAKQDRVIGEKIRHESLIHYGGGG
jgi:hypothetical protein